MQTRIEIERDLLRKIERAKTELCNVRRYLDSGKGIYQVPDKISYAVFSVMDAWLIMHGHTPNYGNGYASMRSQFLENAQGDLRSKVLNCTASASSLEFDLCINEDEYLKRRPFKVWKEEAYLCLQMAEKIVPLIESEVKSYLYPATGKWWYK